MIKKYLENIWVFFCLSPFPFCSSVLKQQFWRHKASLWLSCQVTRQKNSVGQHFLTFALPHVVFQNSECEQLDMWVKVWISLLVSVSRGPEVCYILLLNSLFWTLVLGPWVCRVVLVHCSPVARPKGSGRELCFLCPLCWVGSLGYFYPEPTGPCFTNNSFSVLLLLAVHPDPMGKSVFCWNILCETKDLKVLLCTAAKELVI